MHLRTELLVSVIPNEHTSRDLNQRLSELFFAIWDIPNILIVGLVDGRRRTLAAEGPTDGIRRVEWDDARCIRACFSLTQSSAQVLEH